MSCQENIALNEEPKYGFLDEKNNVFYAFNSIEEYQEFWA